MKLQTQHILNNLEKITAVNLIAKHGSIRSAAKELRISQPSLSVKLKVLEEIFGFKIFRRARTGIEITDSGEIMLRFAKDITERAEELRYALDHIEPMSGCINIGVYDSIARYFWPSFFKSTSRKFPNITMNLHTGRSETIENLLLDRKLDVGIIVEPQPHAKLRQKLLYQDDLSLFCTPEFAKQTFGPKTMGPLIMENFGSKGIALILFSQAILGGKLSLEEKFPQFSSNDFNVHRVENFEIARTFCLESIGVAILPNRVAKEEYNSGKLVKIKHTKRMKPDFGAHSIVLCSQKSSADHPTIATFQSEIVNFIARKQVGKS